MGFDRENHSRCSFTPSVIIHGQIPYKFLICYPHKIKIATTKIMKLCNKTEIRVLNVDLGSDISYHVS